jgi:hypothetical protein
VLSPAISPTLQLYVALEQAFQHFNHTLFAGQLPPCIITLRSSPNIYAYHHSERFINLQGQTIDEIGLHPGHFTLRSVETVLSTLVHEMVHHWQHHFGQCSQRLAHNAQWSHKMREVGLIASHSGLPGGRSTGQRMSHYIAPGGLFIQTCQDLVRSGFELGWYDRELPTEPEHEMRLQSRLAAAGMALPLSPAPVQQIEGLHRL